MSLEAKVAILGFITLINLFALGMHVDRIGKELADIKRKMNQK